MSGDDDHEIIHPPSTLKSKVTVSPGGVDLDMLEKAEEIIAGLQDSYLAWVQDDLAKLQRLFEEAVARPGERPALFKDIFRVAHDVKGQGGSFNYHLMTAVGNQLCRFIERVETPGDQHLDVIKLHIDAMRLIIAERMEGEGDQRGKELVAGLQAVIAKVKK